MEFRLIEKDKEKLKKVMDSLKVIYSVKVMYGGANGLVGYHLYLCGNSENYISGEVLKNIYEFTFKHNYYLWGVNFSEKLGPYIHIIDSTNKKETKEIENDRVKDYIG